MTTKDGREIERDFAWVKQLALLACSYLIITFGQPAYSLFVSMLAAAVGYALFFYQIADLRAALRARIGFSFFFCVQAVQLFWFCYHPVSAVCGAYVLLSFLMGLQFALLCLFVTRYTLTSLSGMLLLASLWTLFEWSRIAWCSGFYFDLAGISLTGNELTLQTASLFGVLGLSFWVMFTNAAVAGAFLLPKKRLFSLAAVTLVAPYLFGACHLIYHEQQQKGYDATHPPLKALIVHSRKVPEEFKKERTKPLTPQGRAYQSWQEIVEAIAPFYGQQFDLLLTPEGFVPYGSRALLFTQDEIQKLFANNLHTPYDPFGTPELCSEDIAQAISTLYQSPVIMGLEGMSPSNVSTRPHYFNSAFFFTPQSHGDPMRYDKQVLVPMGEYIPLEWAKAIAAKYGVFDSFTPGSKAEVFDAGQHKIGPSICYEETVGSLMRQNSLLGATLLVNLTDDYWFPYSMLARQHFDHARPRTVENGTPLLRSCNFGLSGAIDSLGRIVVAKEGTSKPSAFVAQLSSYHYSTPYARFGDLPLLLFSVAIALYALTKWLLPL